MKFSSLCLALSVAIPSYSLLAVETKVTCAEVATVEANCKEYDASSLACDAEVDVGIKAKKDQAKTLADECKKKNGMSYMIKCKKEIKDSATIVNTPRQIAAGPIQKELNAKADSACAKAETLGKANAVCKGPKAVVEAMKRNCIK